MAGTLLQELGHDQVILYFIHKVLRPIEKTKDEKERILFLVVRPATGPRKDVHFWNPEHDEYTSAYNLCKLGGLNFVPEWEMRQTLPTEIIREANKASGYQDAEWYRKLTEQARGDLKNVVDRLESRISPSFNEDLPDLLGISLKGLVLGAEIKYEGFGRKVLPQIENHCTGCLELGIPYYLVIPQNPFYTRFNKKFIEGFLREKPEINLYAFEFRGSAPSLGSIKFERFREK